MAMSRPHQRYESIKFQASLAYASTVIYAQ